MQKFIDLYILKLKPHDKIQNRTTFYFLSPILSPPHFVPTMCGGFYAKFQDSGIKNKKSPQHSVANSRLAIFARRSPCHNSSSWLKLPPPLSSVSTRKNSPAATPEFLIKIEQSIMVRTSIAIPLLFTCLLMFPYKHGPLLRSRASKFRRL